MRFLCLPWILSLALFSCQTPPSKVSKSPNIHDLDQGPRVDALVRAHQDTWLKGLVLDPDQTGVNTLVIMGDSYSDMGNLFLRSRVLGPPQIYWRSRWSDGPIWVDYVQAALGWTVRNYTFVDAEFDEDAQQIPLTSLQAQIDRFAKEAKNVNKQEFLISIWLSPDFYVYRSGKDLVKTAMNEIRSAVSTLDKMGFHHIAVGNLPDMGLLPWVRSPKVPANQRDAWKKIALEHNEALKIMLADLQKKQLDLRAFIFQSFEMQKARLEKAEALGVHLDLDACYHGNARGQFDGERKFCSHPEKAVFWDMTHPNTRLHCFYAAQFLSDVTDAEHIGGYNRDQALDHCQQL